MVGRNDIILVVRMFSLKNVTKVASSYVRWMKMYRTFGEEEKLKIPELGMKSRYF